MDGRLSLGRSGAAWSKPAWCAAKSQNSRRRGGLRMPPFDWLPRGYFWPARSAAPHRSGPMVAAGGPPRSAMGQVVCLISIYLFYLFDLFILFYSIFFTFSKFGVNSSFVSFALPSNSLLHPCLTRRILDYRNIGSILTLMRCPSSS